MERMKLRKNHEKSCISTFNSRNNLSDGYAFCRINAGWILRRIKRKRDNAGLTKELVLRGVRA